jgi:hypothetical protein
MRQLRALVIGALLGVASAPLSAAELPHLVHSGGKHALVIDDAPFLILGDQTDYRLNLTAPTLLKVRLGTVR